MKKVFILFLFNFLVLYSQTKKNTIGIALSRYDNNYISFIKNNIETSLKNKLSLILVDSQNSQAMQNSQIDIFLNNNVNLIALNLIDINSAQKIVNKIAIRNIPIVFFNKEPSSDVFNSYDRVYYIGGRSYDAGITQAKLIENSWNSRASFDKNNDGVLQCIILKGPEDDVDSNIRTDSLKKYLKSKNIKLRVLSEVNANWRYTTASIKMEELLNKYKDKIEYIIASNDDMALGALSTLRKFGYNIDNRRMLNFIPIVGIDGTKEALEEISNYGLYGTVLLNPKTLSEALSLFSLNISQNKSPLDGTTFILQDNKYISIPYIPITYSNLDLALSIYK